MEKTVKIHDKILEGIIKAARDDAKDLSQEYAFRFAFASVMAAIHHQCPELATQMAAIGNAIRAVPSK